MCDSSGRGLKLTRTQKRNRAVLNFLRTTFLPPVPRLRMTGAMPLPPHPIRLHGMHRTSFTTNTLANYGRLISPVTDKRLVRNSKFHHRIHKNTPVDPANARMVDLQQVYTVEEYCLWFKIISNIKWFVACVLRDPGMCQDITSNHTTTIKIRTKCIAAEDKSRDSNTNFINLINFTNLSM